MTLPTTDEPLDVLLERDLLSHYGPMVSGDALRKVLGYASAEAFRQAVARRTVPVPVFALPNRRGKFALAKDIAAWLAVQRARAVSGGTSDRQHGKSNPLDRKGGAP